MIRKLCPSDHEEYLQMADAFYSSPAVCHAVPTDFFEKTFSELMASDVYTECFVHTKQKKIDGYALVVKTFSQEAGGLCIWIDELYVCPQARGQGIGRELLTFIQQKYPNAARFRLEVTPENTGAISLYRRLGFTTLTYSQMIKDQIK